MFAYYARGRHATAGVAAPTMAHSPRQARQSTPLQPTMHSPEQHLQQQPNNMYVFQGVPSSRASRSGAKLHHSTNLVKAGIFLLVGVILAGPINTGSRMGMGVFAAPCASVNTTTSETGSGDVQQITVTQTTALDLTSEFDCEGGEFEVYWSGEVGVTGTIVIGSGTTVRIFGDGNSSDDISTLSISKGLEELTSGRALPFGLTSAAVGVGPANITSETDTSTSFGPMFYIDGGHLILEDLVVRGGLATNTTGGLHGIGGGPGRGGGVHALNSTVSVTRCYFSDNFAEHWGGGIFANGSTLQIVDSVFSGCDAGFQSTVEDEDLEGAGGGVWAELSEVLVDGCLFERCYAKRKGGGASLKNGNMSVLDSVFYNNSAGGDNIEHEEVAGEGAGLAFEACHQAFDGRRACGVNDTLFDNSRVAKKGGAVAIGSGDGRSHVEFHRCRLNGSSTGKAIKDDPQGEGGAFSVGGGVTLILSDCVINNSYCGKKGGALALSNGEDWIDDPGAILILRNSSFQSNFAELDNGGVVNVAEFSRVTVEGDENLFEGNKCGEDGGVFASTVHTLITVEGGTFKGNTCELNGGVFWSKGNISILGGAFTENESAENGGVLFGTTETSFLAVKGGIFEHNTGQDGAVAAVDDGSNIQVEDGVFTGNVAERQGGVLSSSDRGCIQITGGGFAKNMADYGGFLYKEGEGETSCTGASILQHQGVDGGAIHAVDGAVLDWACDIGNNSALAGPAIYARDNATVELRGISLFGNTVARGSVVFVVDSVLKTYQVDFVDFSGSTDVSAVQVDQASSYMAEDTSFTGFEGEAVVFSEGELFLDDCDFSGSTSSVLVYSDPSSTAVIRNTALGDNNYFALAKASSEARELPNATSLTNVNLRCRDAGGDESTSSPRHDLCSDGSACLDGDVGVYCQCYKPKRPNSAKRCVSGNATGLNLTSPNLPEITYFPGLLEGDLLLSYDPTANSNSSSGISSGSGSGGNGTEMEEGSHGGGEGGVLWSVEASVVNAAMMTWTIFPSTGLLLPGQNITLRVATSPSTYFDGTDRVTFEAIDVVSVSTASASTSSSIDGHDDGNSIVASGTASTTASFEVTFFHCVAGSFWDRDLAGFNDSDEHAGTCEPCNDEGTDAENEGVDCSQPGETLQTLSIKEGYWRADLDLSYSRECFNEGACKGGSNVSKVQEYCNDGYEGVVCSVCSQGYGRGAANQCHQCSEGFKGGMFFVLAVAALLALVVIMLLAVYLVGGRGAVSSTVASTKQSVIMLQNRSVDMLSRSDAGGVIDFSDQQGARGARSGFSHSPRFHRRRRIGGTVSTPGRSRTSSSSRNGGVGRRITGLNSVRGGGVPVKPNLPHGTSFPPRSLSSDARLAPTLAPVNEVDIEDVPVVSGINRTAYSEPGLTPAYTAPAAVGDGQRQNKRNENPGALDKKVPEREESTAAGRIGAILTALPLSKLKIVIVVWQISGAFADVTNVGFPPIYEKFLSTIGIFSLDLGWLLSATCVASGVDFYDKLLIVTIGPLVFLGLLGVTFRLGSRPARLGVNPPDKRSERTQHRATREATGGRVNPTKPESMSTRLDDNTRDSNASSFARQGQATPEKGVKSNAIFSTITSNTTRGARIGWGTRTGGVTHFDGVGAPDGVGKSSAPPERACRSAMSSGRSLRAIWKAGPGNKTDSEQDRFWELFARHTTMTLIILYLVYSQVSTVVFQTFACDDYPEIGTRYLRADGRIECDTPKHTGYMVYAGIMIALYPFGIPALFCYLLVRQRSAINPPSDKSVEDSRGTQYVVREKINQREDDESIAPTSFLWGAYYPNRYYFEVFECMRRLLLTGLLVFANTSEQVAYGCIFAFISLLAFELQRPHIDALEIQLYRTGCLVIFFTNFLALIIQVELADEESRNTAVYSVLLILVHVLFFLSICWNSWTTMKATFNRRHVQGIVLGVDLVGEDSADRLLGPKKAKGGKVPSKSDSEYKAENEEELPAWQDQPAIPEMYVGINISDSGGSGSVGGRNSRSSSSSSSSWNSSRYGSDHPDKHSKTSSTNVPPPY